MWLSGRLAPILLIALIALTGGWLVASDMAAPDVASSPFDPVATPALAAEEIPARSAVLLASDAELIRSVDVAPTPGQRPIPAKVDSSVRAMALPSAPVSSVHPEGVPTWTTAPERAALPPQGLFPPATAHPRQEEALGAVTPVMVPPVPPGSVQMRMDQRGDLPGWRRDVMLDGYGGPRRNMPLWRGFYEGTLERYPGRRWTMPRRRGYLDRQSDGGWMDTICPWSNPRHDWPARRGYGW